MTAAELITTILNRVVLTDSERSEAAALLAADAKEIAAAREALRELIDLHNKNSGMEPSLAVVRGEQALALLGQPEEGKT